MRYNFSKKQIIKNSLITFLYAFIINMFLLACISQIYTGFSLELLACVSLSLGITAIYATVSYLRHARKTFSVDEEGIIFFLNNQEVKRILHSELVETNIAKSIFKGNRIINLTTKNETISFAVNFRVYQRIRGFFPIFNDRKEEGLIKIDSKYKYKTLYMRLTVILFYSLILSLLLTPIMLGLLYSISDYYQTAKRVYFIILLVIIGVLLITYLVYFYIKYFMYSRHSLRFDGSLKVEYYKWGKQKCNYEIKSIAGIREVHSIFSFLFGIVQVYLIHKTTDDVIVNSFIPFCLTKTDAKKLRDEIFGEEVLVQKPGKKIYAYCAFPIILISSLIIFLSVLYTPNFLFAFIGVFLYYAFFIKNRAVGVGENTLCFVGGSMSKTVYYFKREIIKGFTATERFFETKAPYLCYEILIEGENGVYVLGPYERNLSEKIKEKLKDN